jgi:hypothetical protein
MIFDPATAAIAAVAFALGGIFNGLVTAMTGEYRARRDDGRAAGRARADRLRTHRIEQIETLQREVITRLYRYGAQAIGRPLPEEDLSAEPNWSLLGDREVLRRLFDVEIGLVKAARSGGDPEVAFAPMWEVEPEVADVLERQRLSVLSDEPVRFIPAAEVKAEKVRRDHVMYPFLSEHLGPPTNLP